MPVTPTIYANQSVTLVELLDALKANIQAATRLGDEAVVEWHAAGRPDANIPSSRLSTYVWFRYVDGEVDNDSGAGRYGLPCTCQFEVNIVTRGFEGKAQTDRKLMRRHLAFRLLLENAFYGRMLFDSYDLVDIDGGDLNPPQTTYTTRFTDVDIQDRREGAAGVVPGILSIAPMSVAKLPAAERPRPEQGQIETRLGVAIQTVLRVTLDDIATLEEE